MKRNKVASRVALSAVLFAAVASPVAANAAITPVLTKHYAASLEKSGAGSKPAVVESATLISDQAFSTTKAIKLADPLELAREHAPETADAWKTTLDKYDAAMKKLVKNGSVQADSVTLQLGEELKPGEKLKAVETGTAAAVLVPAGGEVSSSNISITRATLPASADPSVKQSLQLRGKAATTASSQAIEIKLGEPVVKEGKSSSAAAPVYVTLETEKKGMTGVASQATLTRSSSFSSTTDESKFFQAQLQLAEAAESKDSATIKEALAKLLPLYEKQIEQLESLIVQEQDQQN